MHGNEDGVELTNGEIITWQDLTLYLTRLNDRLGYFDFSRKFGVYEPLLKQVSPFYLSFSTCNL